MHHRVNVRALNIFMPARAFTRFRLVVSLAALLYAAAEARDGSGPREPRKAAAAEARDGSGPREPRKAVAAEARDGSGPREPRKAAAAEASRRSGIEARQATSDFKTMHAIFAQAHASAFRHVRSGELPDLFKDAGTVSIRDFVIRVLGYYRDLKVDHTGLGFSPELIHELGLRNAMFPFPLKFFAGRAYFDCEYHDIPFGSEMTQINGRLLSDILADMDKVSSTRNKAGKRDDYRLEENFSFLYYMARGEEKEWNITVVPPGEAKPRIIQYRRREGGNPPLIMRRSAASSLYQQPITTLFNPGLKLAYIAINSFVPTGNQLDTVDSWHNHLNLFHQEAKARNPENLVIDLRMNRGGIMLFSAVAAQWFIEDPLEDRSISRARTRVLPYRELVQAINGQGANATALGDAEKHLQAFFGDKMQDGYFDTRKAEARFLELKPIPVAHRFKRVFVLVGPATYSSAVNFARYLKIANKNVLLVGDETGSPGDGHSAEILVMYKLPATGLLFEIPLVRVQFSPLVPQQPPGRGLIPDMPVAESAADFIAGRDAVLEAVGRKITAK